MRRGSNNSAPKRMWGESFAPSKPVRPKRLMWFEAAIAFAAIFAVALYVMSPRAPGRAEISAFVETRTSDQNFSGCDAARAAGRESIPRHDPSYREWMDGDGDGLACEPNYGSRG